MKFPKEIIEVSKKLKAANFQAFLVGGCVRDLFLKREPKDWDIATDAKPEEIQAIFPDSVYENDFGTVAVKTSALADAPTAGVGATIPDSLKIIEITTFRLESSYSDKRHPDQVKFTTKVEEDLSRRDFTINAIALDIDDPKNPLDPFNGLKDIDNKKIKTVGDPQERFSEDALRLMRAVRFSIELDFKIETKTLSAIKKNAPLLDSIARERIRDEFIKIINTPQASAGLKLLHQTNLLQSILPELLEGDKVSQNWHHIYDVFEHSLRSLEYSAQKGYSLEVRLASLLHDIGKPRTKSGKGEKSTFYAHEIVGAKMASHALKNLHFSKKIIDKVYHLVRFHMFNYNVGEVSEAGVRRLIARVGLEHLDDLLKVREADRIGSGVPKAFPYKLRHLLYMIDKVRRDPISPKTLKINGDQLMKLLKLKPSPKVGMILHALLDEVIEEPAKNNLEHLQERAQELNQLKDSQLTELMEQSKKKQEEFETAVDEKIKGRHYVK